ncbi:Acg family FMN-binding oxidoreductase [Streptomyces specialis]|uniref:Acg family FMN-binding oxidoreductase n=1 Tax=Streptomyces specialis TaxID=498367 RepID=UPI00073E8729|nr:nitroreductase family protein [Streptomyces specialis]
MRVETPDTRTVTALAEAASAAPSLHNAQPWRFHYLRGEATFQVRASLDRTLPHSDPHGRALHMGCGAALLNLRVAAAHAGWRPVTTLLPDPYDPRLLATVELVPDGRDGTGGDPEVAALAELYPAIGNRRSSRLPFGEERVPDPVRSALRDAAETEGAQLHFPSAWHITTVLDMTQDAEGRDLAVPGRLEELAQWSETDGGPPARDFAGRLATGDHPAATDPGPPPQLALLGTAEDRTTDWVRAGQAMERVLLEATRHGLSTGLSATAMEWADLRWTDRDPLSEMGQVHAVLRFGHGPGVPATPRRPVSQVLRVENGPRHRAANPPDGTS